MHAAARRDRPETFVGLQPKQTGTYLRLGAMPWVEHICETGFGGGHSTVSLLFAQDNSHAHTFDVHRFSFSPIATHFVNKYFPHRTTLVVGDSKLTVPQYQALHPDLKCNIIHIDGGWKSRLFERKGDCFVLFCSLPLMSLVFARPFPFTGSPKAERVFDDLLHFISMADCRNVLIVPGVYLHTPHKDLERRSEGVRSAYLRAKHSGLLTEWGCFEFYEWLDEAEWRHLDEFDGTGRQPTSFCLATLHVPGCSAQVQAEARASVQQVIAAMHLEKGFTTHIPLTLPASNPPNSNERGGEFDVFVMRAGSSSTSTPPSDSASASDPSTSLTSSSASASASSSSASSASVTPSASASAVWSAGASTPPPPPPPALLMFVSGNGAIDMLQSTEQSGLNWHSRTIALPAAKPSSAASSASGGAVWDTFVSRPCVTYQRHKQKYHMWYTGSDPDGSGGTPTPSRGAPPVTAIGYAISAELPVFTRQSRAPVLTPTYAWERGGVSDPFVVWDEKKRHWKMWYSAFSRVSEDESSSSDTPPPPPASVVEDGSEALPTDSAEQPPSPGLNLYARPSSTSTSASSSATTSAGAGGSLPPLGSIGYAWSEDGLNWHKRSEPVLAPVRSSRSESRVVSTPYVVQRRGWYVMFYQSQGGSAPYDPAFDDEVLQQQAAEQRHRAGTKAPPPQQQQQQPPQPHREQEQATASSSSSHNMESAGPWSHSAARARASRKQRADGSAVPDDARSGLWVINVARSRDGVSWERSAYNPVLSPTPGSFDSDSVSRPSALLLAEEEQWAVWFVGVRDGDTETLALATSSVLALFDEAT